jgi:hypothetical protein
MSKGDSDLMLFSLVVTNDIESTLVNGCHGGLGGRGVFTKVASVGECYCRLGVDVLAQPSGVFGDRILLCASLHACPCPCCYFFAVDEVWSNSRGKSVFLEMMDDLAKNEKKNELIHLKSARDFSFNWINDL